MTSHRHKSEPRDAYLDAARACLLDVGWRRTTLTEVARRAGVSRMTIYRAWPDMTALLGDLMTREWGELLLAGSPTDAVTAVTPASIADAVLAQIRGLRGNELFSRILEVDPELVLPYLFERRGRTQELIAAVLAEQVARGQRAGSVRPGEPVVLARAVLLLSHGFALSAHTMTDATVAAEDLDAELRRAVEGLLRPDPSPDPDRSTR